MTEHHLTCFSGFHCIAGACPDTCCRGWDIDLDPAALALYQSMSGPLGRELRGIIHPNQDGGWCFRRTGSDSCPFLTGNHLCRLILSGGDQFLCTTCREHPRFYSAYGDYLEHVLSLSCPEAARLLLTEPFGVSEIQTDRQPEDDWMPEPDLLKLVFLVRDRLLSLCRKTAVPLLPTYLESLGLQIQTALDSRQDNRILKMLDQPTSFGSAAYPAEQFLSLLPGLEFTDRTLPELIASVQDLPQLSDLPEDAQNRFRRILSYYLYRYLPDGVWDAGLLCRIRFSFLSAELISRLAGLCPDLPSFDCWARAVSLWSREVEHSDQNLDMLMEALAIYS